MSSIIIISSQQRIRFTLSSLRDGVGLGMGQNEETCWTKLKLHVLILPKICLLFPSTSDNQTDNVRVLVSKLFTLHHF